jgi:hypothetical protein
MSDSRHHAIDRAASCPKGSRVLDLGCGDGALLDLLQRERGCSGYGIEIADDNVLACVKRGVNVIQLNLDEGLSMFDDASLRRGAADRHAAAPAQCRDHAARDRARGQAGHRRLSQLRALAQPLSIVRGRMPVTKRLPYQWYDTPNIRVGTFKDFEVLAHQEPPTILEPSACRTASERPRLLPNLTARAPRCFKFERGS